MSSALAQSEEPEFQLDTSHLITEDDEPLDSTFQERQQRILPDALYASWKPGTTFLAFSNVGLFHNIRKQGVVPDVLVSLDVEPLPFEQSKSYFVWEYGKPPDLVVEVVSKKVNSEDEDKLALYAQIGVSYYVIYDPYAYLSKIPLRVYIRTGRGLIPQTHYVLDELGLGVREWEGCYAGCHGRFLRFTDPQGNLLLTGGELAEKTQGEADTARAELQAEREQRERLEKKLRELGVEP